MWSITGCLRPSPLQQGPTSVTQNNTVTAPPSLPTTMFTRSSVCTSEVKHKALSLAGAGTSIIFAVTKVLSRQTRVWWPWTDGRTTLTCRGMTPMNRQTDNTDLQRNDHEQTDRRTTLTCRGMMTMKRQTNRRTTLTCRGMTTMNRQMDTTDLQRNDAHEQTDGQHWPAEEWRPWTDRHRRTTLTCRGMTTMNRQTDRQTTLTCRGMMTMNRQTDNTQTDRQHWPAEEWRPWTVFSPCRSGHAWWRPSQLRSTRPSQTSALRESCHGKQKQCFNSLSSLLECFTLCMWVCVHVVCNEFCQYVFFSKERVSA